MKGSENLFGQYFKAAPQKFGPTGYKTAYASFMDDHVYINYMGKKVDIGIRKKEYFEKYNSAEEYIIKNPQKFINIFNFTQDDFLDEIEKELLATKTVKKDKEVDDIIKSCTAPIKQTYPYMVSGSGSTGSILFGYKYNYYMEPSYKIKLNEYRPPEKENILYKEEDKPRRKIERGGANE